MTAVLPTTSPTDSPAATTASASAAVTSDKNNASQEERQKLDARGGGDAIPGPYVAEGGMERLENRVKSERRRDRGTRL